MMNKIFILTIIYCCTFTLYPQDMPKTFFHSPDKSELYFKTDTSRMKSLTGLPMINHGFYEVSANFRPFPSSNATQSEFSIDVYPYDENKIFYSANTTNWPVTFIYGTGVYCSEDGGESWMGTDYPPYGINYGYPSCAIANNGHYFEGYMNTARGQCIAVSTNGGGTWSAYNICSVTGENDILDKNNLCIDKIKGSPFENRLYSGWTRFQEGHVNNNRIEFSYSSDLGKTWSAPVNISAGVNSGSHDYGINIQSGPDGKVYCTWAVYDEWTDGAYGEDAIGFNISSDGGENWGGAKRIFSFKNFGINGYLKNSKIRVASFPSMAVNYKNGEIYISWVLKEVNPGGNDPDVVLMKSTDEGNTWSTPVRVNNDLINNGKDQYYNWCTIDHATGCLYILFYDSRNVSNDSAEVYLARSSDGGKTFENIRISDEVFKPKPIAGLSNGYQGDYIGISALKNFVYTIWGDDRTGNYQGWMTKLRFLPEIIHIPLSDNADLDGPYRIDLQIKSVLPLKNDNLYLFYRRDNLPFDSVLLLQSGENYIGYIPGDGQPHTYSYFISAEDNNGGKSRLPYDGSFSFKIVNDVPVIRHIPLQDQLIERWPPKIITEVTSLTGIIYAKVEFKQNEESPGDFDLVQGDGNNWSGYFKLASGDLREGDTIAYRITAKAEDGIVTYLPAEGYFKFLITSPQALILLVDDEDSSLYKTGPSSSIISEALSYGAVLFDYIKFNDISASLINDYDAVVLCAGTKKTKIFDDLLKRKAIIDYNKKGGKVFVEGGEVGWIYRFSSLTPEKDPVFRRTILKDSTWVNDYKGGLLNKRFPSLPLFITPDYIEDSISFNEIDPVGETDVMNILPNTPGVYKIMGWIPRYPDTVGIIVYSPTSDINKITNIFCSFSFGAISDSIKAGNLARNLILHLLDIAGNDTISEVDEKVDNCLTFRLEQNYPNPFNTGTMINYSLIRDVHVKITVFNVLGEEAAVLIDDDIAAGTHSLYFNASSLPSGVYFYSFEAGELRMTRKMILLK